MKVFGLEEFAAHLLTLEADMKLAEDVIVLKGCKDDPAQGQELYGP